MDALNLNSKINRRVNGKRFREEGDRCSASISKGSCFLYYYTLKLKYIQSRQFVFFIFKVGTQVEQIFTKNISHNLSNSAYEATWDKMVRIDSSNINK